MGIGGALSALFCRQIDRLSAAVGGSSFDNKTTPYVGHFSSDRMRLKFQKPQSKVFPSLQVRGCFGVIYQVRGKQ